MHSRLHGWLILALVLILADAALAGMPSISLSDVARMRVQTISFFAAAVFVAAWVVKALWNSVARDLGYAPQVSYRAALFGTVLWGLLFLFVLTMISGARELMTPGAWEKRGLTYKLATSSADGADGVAAAVSIGLDERRSRLEQLRTALLIYAATHNGNFPASPEEAGFSDDFWRQPGFVDVRYGYHAGRSMDQKESALAFEQAVYGDDRQMVLYVDGSLRTVEVSAAADVSPPEGSAHAVLGD